MTRLFRSLSLAACAVVLAAGPAQAHEPEGDEATPEMTKGEQKLAKLLEGRVAGEPVSCISAYPNDDLTVIDGTALVYGRGRTIYVNTTRHPEDIDGDDILVIRRTGSQLCRLDNVTMIDRMGGFFSGAIFLTDFVPYTRVEDDTDKGD